MKRTIVSVITFSIIILLTYSCTEVEADFTYSPEQPKAGEKVTFTNTSTNGDKWEWSFGDGETVTVENPVHTYKKSGTFTVRLRVNGQEKHTAIKQIQVFDSIPTIVRSLETVDYYKEVTYSVLAYNPNKLPVSYKWTFSENAESDSITNREATSSTVKVLFTKRNIEENVKLEITIGTNTFEISDAVFVNDVALRSLFYAVKGGNIFRQRILASGTEEPINMGVSSGIHPFNMTTYNDKLYIFDVGSEIAYSGSWGSSTAGNGRIRVMDIKTKVTEEVINNLGASPQYGFFNGYIDNNNIYWTDYSDFVYTTPITTRSRVFSNADAVSSSSYYFTDMSKLGLTTGNFSGGFRWYDNTCFWAKGGGVDKGIYKFRSSGGVVTVLDNILTEYAIRAFTIDTQNQKIYFSAIAPVGKTGLWAANFDGTNAVRIDDAPMNSPELYISSIAVDNASRKVYWSYRSPEEEGATPPSEGTWTRYYEKYPTHRTGIKQSELITSKNAESPNAVEYFLLNVGVYGLAVDNVVRYAD